MPREGIKEYERWTATYYKQNKNWKDSDVWGLAQNGSSPFFNKKGLFKPWKAGADSDHVDRTVLPPVGSWPEDQSEKLKAWCGVEAFCRTVILRLVSTGKLHEVVERHGNLAPGSKGYGKGAPGHEAFLDSLCTELYGTAHPTKHDVQQAAAATGVFSHTELPRGSRNSVP